MTKIDEHNDYSSQDNNLDRLLKLGDPLPKMPENLKARIRTRLAEVGQDSGKKNFLFRRWAIVSPLAAAAVLAIFLIFFWPGGKHDTISWADVQKKLGQIHTLTAKSFKEITTTEGKRIIKRSKIYMKDPGFYKIEYYPPNADLNADKPKPESIFISKSEPGLSEYLLVYPNSQRAERATHIFHTNSQEPPTQPIIDLASENWKFYRQITADKTKRIGDRVINGVPAVGFEFDAPAKGFCFYIPKDEPAGQAHVQIWASRDDAVPLLGEVEFLNTLGQTVHIVDYDIQRNLPLEQGLFDLGVPEGWSIRQSRFESAEYTGTGLAPNVILQIGPEGQRPIAATGDVAGVVSALQEAIPDSNITSIHITIDLKPEAAKRLHDYTNAHPGQLIIVNFNGQIKVAAKLDVDHPTQLNFNLILLGLSLSELEEKYFTTSIERRN